MEKVEIIKKGIKTSIASVDNIGGKEHVILGDYQRDLILRTKGSVRIQVNNKFYDILNEELSTSTDANGGVLIIEGNIENLSPIPIDGSLVFSKETSSLYIIIDGQPLELNSEPSNGNGGISLPFVSYENVQNFSREQVERVQSNIQITYPNIESFLVNPWESKLGYIKSEHNHYIIYDNAAIPLYISSLTGGVINNTLTITKEGITNVRNATLTVESNWNNSIITDGYSGLFVGNLPLTQGIGLHSDGVNNFITSLGDNLVVNTERASNLLTISDLGVSVGFNSILNGDYFFVVNESSYFKDITLKEKLKSENYSESYGNYFDLVKGFSLYNGDDGWTLEVDRLIEKGIDTHYNKLSGLNFQKLINNSTRIINKYTTPTGIEVEIDGNVNYAVNDVVLIVCANQHLKTTELVLGTVESVTVENNYVVLNITAAIRNNNLLFSNLINMSSDNILLDTFDRSIVGYKSMATLQEVINNLSVDDLDQIYEIFENGDEEFLHLKIQSAFVHSKIGNLTNINDTSFTIEGETGLYSNNAYIKGEADLNYLKLGNELLYKDGVLTITDSYRKYGLGVTSSVAYGSRDESGMYGMISGHAERPEGVTGISGSVLRMQSGASGYQSELWLTGTNVTAKPMAYIRHSQGNNKTTWAKLWSSGDFTQTNINDWNKTVTNSIALSKNETNQILIDSNLSGSTLHKGNFIAWVSSGRPEGLPTDKASNGGFLTNNFLATSNGYHRREFFQTVGDSYWYQAVHNGTANNWYRVASREWVTNQDYMPYEAVKPAKITTNDPTPLALIRTGSQLSISFTNSNLTRYLGVDSSGDLRFGSSNNIGTVSKVYHTGNLDLEEISVLREEAGNDANLGYRIKNADMTFFGPIGNGATDLSIKHTLPATAPFLHLQPYVTNALMGATGRYAFAINGSNVAKGDQSFASGLGSVASGTSSFVTGQACQALGTRSFSAGDSNTSSGALSATLGGSANVAEGNLTAIIAGINNKTVGQNSVVVGGNSNNTGNTNATVMGGYDNKALGITSSIIGSQSSTVNAHGASALSSSNVIIDGNGSTSIASQNSTVNGEVDSIIASTGAAITQNVNFSALLATIDCSINSVEGGGINSAIIASNGCTINMGQPGSSTVKWNNAIIAAQSSVINAGMSYNLVTGQGTIGTASAQLVIGTWNLDEPHLSVSSPLKKTFVIGGGSDANNRKTTFYIQHDGLVVAINDIEISDFSKGVILRSPDNSRWRVTIDNNGALNTTKL